jgi:hypothetical protein
VLPVFGLVACGVPPAASGWPSTALKLGLHPALLEEETSTGAVLSTAASVITVSLVMAALTRSG